MLKESILFVASTGLLIYFIAPSDEPAKPEAVGQEEQKMVTPAVQTADDGWGYDDDDGDGESFVFGEPVTEQDGDDDDQSRDEDDSSDRQRQSDNTGSKTSYFTDNRTMASADSPGSGQKGSIDNPIIFKTNNPSDPIDD